MKAHTLCVQSNTNYKLTNAYDRTNRKPMAQHKLGGQYLKYRQRIFG